MKNKRKIKQIFSVLSCGKKEIVIFVANQQSVNKQKPHIQM